MAIMRHVEYRMILQDAALAPGWGSLVRIQSSRQDVGGRFLSEGSAVFFYLERSTAPDIVARV